MMIGLIILIFIVGVILWILIGALDRHSTATYDPGESVSWIEVHRNDYHPIVWAWLLKQTNVDPALEWEKLAVSPAVYELLICKAKKLVTFQRSDFTDENWDYVCKSAGLSTDRECFDAAHDSPLGLKAERYRNHKRAPLANPVIPKDYHTAGEYKPKKHRKK